MKQEQDVIKIGTESKEAIETKKIEIQKQELKDKLSALPTKNKETKMENSIKGNQKNQSNITTEVPEKENGKKIINKIRIFDSTESHQIARLKGSTLLDA